MLDNFIDNLQDSINWAHFHDDIETLNLARYRMDQLQAAVCTLPGEQQKNVQQQIDDVLPMEWPLWMEACRYNDGEKENGAALLTN